MNKQFRNTNNTKNNPEKNLREDALRIVGSEKKKRRFFENVKNKAH